MVEPQSTNKALTTKELAEYFNISQNTAYELLHAQRFPALRIRTGKGRGCIRVMKDDLDA